MISNKKERVKTELSFWSEQAIFKFRQESISQSTKPNQNLTIILLKLINDNDPYEVREE